MIEINTTPGSWLLNFTQVFNILNPVENVENPAENVEKLLTMLIDFCFGAKMKIKKIGCIFLAEIW